CGRGGNRQRLTARRVERTGGMLLEADATVSRPLLRGVAVNRLDVSGGDDRTGENGFLLRDVVEGPVIALTLSPPLHLIQRARHARHVLPTNAGAANYRGMRHSSLLSSQQIVKPVVIPRPGGAERARH